MKLGVKSYRSFKLQGARDLAYKQAQNLRDVAYARQNIAKAALELKMKVLPPLWMTMSENQALAGPFTQSLREKLFELGDGDISDMLEIPGGYVVAQVKSIKRPEASPFEEVKNKVSSDFRVAEARKLALKQASAMLEKAKAEKSLAAVGKADKIDFMQSGYFSRQTPDKYLPLLKGANLERVFNLRGIPSVSGTAAGTGHQLHDMPARGSKAGRGCFEGAKRQNFPHDPSAETGRDLENMDWRVSQDDQGTIFE